MAQEIKWSKHADRKFDKILEYLENEWGKMPLLKEHMSFLIY